jgi:hypothetical protein
VVDVRPEDFGIARMAERNFAAVLILLFGCFLYVAFSDIVHLVEAHMAEDIFLLVYCVIVCLGWIAFLAALFLESRAAEHGSLGGTPWKEERAGAEVY